MSFKKIEKHEIVTVKFHCKLKKGVVQCLCTNVKRLNNHFKNFCIHKNEIERGQKITFVIFKSGFVNVCGLKEEKDTKKCFILLRKIVGRQNKKFRDCFEILENEKYLVVDNITLTGNLTQNIPFDFFVADKWTKQNCCKVKSNFNDSHFPAWFLKFSKSPGTVILFRSGKFNVVGLQCQTNCRVILQLMDVFIHNILRTLQQQQLSAFYVVEF